MRRELDSRITMFDRLPPLQTLRAFEATGRLLSMTLAAEELHVTHGAVSRHIRTLEDDLGIPLFRRIRNHPLTGHIADIMQSTTLTHMYGPAVRCKRVSSSWRWA